MRKLIKTYRQFFSIAFLKGMCGTVFEDMCHLRFQEQILIRHVRMVRLSGPTRMWNSSHHSIQDKGLEELRKVAFHERVTLNVFPSRTCVYYGDELDPEPGVYCEPKKTNQVAMDSFIFYKDTLYIFQFTVSGEHGINDGLVEACAKLSIPDTNWCFIFVIPDDVKLLKCCYSKMTPALKGVVPRSAQIVVEDWTKPVERSVGSKVESAETVEKAVESISEGPSEKAEEPLLKKQKITGAEGSNDGEGSKLQERKMSKAATRGKGKKGK
jgi:hypothetical protein